MCTNEATLLNSVKAVFHYHTTNLLNVFQQQIIRLLLDVNSALHAVFVFGMNFFNLYLLKGATGSGAVFFRTAFKPGSCPAQPQSSLQRSVLLVALTEGKVHVPSGDNRQVCSLLRET